MSLPLRRQVKVTDEQIVASLPGHRRPIHDEMSPPVTVPAVGDAPSGAVPVVPLAPADAAATPDGHDLLDALRAFEDLVGESVADSPQTPAGEVDAAAATSRILIMAERLAIFAAASLSGCAMLAARVGGLPVHPLALAVWSVAGCLAALCLAGVATDPTASGSRRSGRSVLAAVLLVALLVCLTGAVAAADGVAGPAWVLFLPVVVIAGAVGGAVPGLLTGAGAAAGTYAAAALGHTLSVAGVGRLVVVLPVFPALGLATGALCGWVHRAAREAREQQSALQADVVALSELLGAVAGGDLAAPASLPAAIAGTSRAWSDPATEGLAVVLADTLVALRRLVARLSLAGDQVLSAADELATTASIHVEAVDTQSVAVTQTTTTIDQLAATAVAIADTAARVSQSAVASRADARRGAEAVQRSAESARVLAERTAGLTERARTLEQLVDRVDSATKVMDELSRRTSMLALSAAIEAASAHQHAAGFGNVAAEVRSLAERAREATAGIDGIVRQLRAEIAATAEAARQGADAVTVGAQRQRHVEAALATITDMIERTSAAAGEIDAATRQQRLAADAVVQAMASVEAASTQARVATGRHSESAGRLRDLATGVRDTIAQFRLPGTGRVPARDERIAA